MTMLFNFGGAKKTTAPAAPKPAAKAAPAKAGTTSFKPTGQTANKGTYVPDGLTAEQYAKQLAAEAAKRNAKKTRFPLGIT